MNEHDKNNLKFILKCSNKDFDAWMEEASADDISYALQLIHTSKAELMVEQMELQDTAIMYEDDIVEAKHILDRIKNVGINRKDF
jgi:hypothetical protein